MLCSGLCPLLISIENIDAQTHSDVYTYALVSVCLAIIVSMLMAGV